MRADGSPLKVKVLDEQAGYMQKQSLVVIRWKIRVPDIQVGAGEKTFIPIGDS